MFFDVFCSFQRLFRVFRFPQVAQIYTLGEVGTWMFVWWPVVSGIFIPTIVKIWQSFFKLQLIVLGIFFDTQCSTLKHLMLHEKSYLDLEKKVLVLVLMKVLFTWLVYCTVLYHRPVVVECWHTAHRWQHFAYLSRQLSLCFRALVSKR